MKVEFGAENINPVHNYTPEEIDSMIKQGKTPEQFLSTYDFDETARDVICFRLPTLRDIQIYDVVKTIDGLYGIVVAMQSYPFAYVRNNSYNFSPFSHSEIQLNSLNPLIDLHNTTKFDSLDRTYIQQIEVIHLSNKDSSRQLKELINILQGNSQGQKKWSMQSYRITDICEIHKNIHPLSKIK